MWQASKSLKLLAAATAGGSALAIYYTMNAGNTLSISENEPRKDLANLPGALPYKVPSREEQLKQLRSGKTFDLLVIGGGATGVGVALDAASRGLDVALVERDDFSSGTSSRSTKLIHGGVRYLQKAVLELDFEQYRMVKEALHERSTLLRIAPHLTTHLPIMLPIYKWWQVPYYWGGSKLYDIVAGTRGLESSYFLSSGKALEKFPMLKKEKLVGAMVYYDGQHNDSRMNVAVALTAAAYGAVIVNHAEVQSLVKTKDEDGKEHASGAFIKDEFTGEIFEVKAKGIVNATGPFTDSIRKMDDPSTPPIVQPSAGVHIILPDYYSPQNMGLIDPSTSDGRVIFFLPWEGGTIAGTTDSPTEVTPDPVPKEEEIQWILKEVRGYLSADVEVRRGDVLAAWSGIRPLVRDPKKKNTESLARNHIVDVSPTNVVTISGGKWTTFRAMAADAVDAAIKACKLEPKMPCHTDSIMLIGGHGYYKNMYINLIQKFGLDKQVASHLATTYGDRAPEVARLAGPTNKRWPVMGNRLVDGYPYIEAEVLYAVRHEYAGTIVDVIGRRMRLAFINAAAAWDVVPKVADVMAAELKWSKLRKAQEIEKAKKFLLTMGLNDVASRSAFNAQELIQFHQDFSELDSNNDGYVTKQEIREYIAKKGMPNFKDDDLDKFFAQVDRDHNGVIEFNEYLELMIQIKKGNAQPGIFQSFIGKRLSTDRSGGGV